MSYPQPNSDIPATDGQNYFRLNTPLVSPGDIYESVQGANAFALGPESDVARVTLNYYDPQASPTFVNEAQISPERGFIGSVFPTPQKYQPSNRGGRILISSTDIYQPAYVPVNYPVDEVQRFTPQLDVIEYFGALPSITPARVDKQYLIQPIVQTPGDDSLGMIIPYYGRRFASYRFLNTAGHDVTFGVFGVTYAIFPSFLGWEVILHAPAAVATGNAINGVVKGSSDGYFDALLFVFDSLVHTVENVQLRLWVSDVESP